ncbi:MAG: hypothetical protein AAGC60_20585 [Acidobacteriota bacterium]
MRHSRSILVVLSCLFAFAGGAVFAEAPVFDRDQPAAPHVTVLPDVVSAEEVLLFGMPAERLAVGQRVDVAVTTSERLLANESLRILEAQVEGGFVAVELFAESPSTHDLLARLSDDAVREVRVAIEVDGVAYAEMTLPELMRASADTRALGVLPSATEIVVDGAEPRLPVCGDGQCGGGGPIPLVYFGGEDCETCPQDCGGPCSICGNGFCGQYENCSSCPADCGSCPVCPEVIGTETRTQLLSSTSLGWQCLKDFIWWDQSVYYDYTKFDYKSFTVERERQCNGTITETVVPGSTSYFSSYCYRHTSIPCFGGFYTPGCITF